MITNQIFEAYRAEKEEITKAIELLKSKGYVIYQTKVSKEEV